MCKDLMREGKRKHLMERQRMARVSSFSLLLFIVAHGLWHSLETWLHGSDSHAGLKASLALKLLRLEKC